MSEVSVRPKDAVDKIIDDRLKYVKKVEGLANYIVEKFASEHVSVETAEHVLSRAKEIVRAQSFVQLNPRQLQSEDES